MKRLVKKTKHLIKGTPAAILVSAAIHALLLLLAGGVVVVSIIEKQDKKFIPRKINRPAMKLRKLRVKVKKTSKPRKTARRITRLRTQAMPDIQVPEMTAMGSGLENGVGGFEMLAELSRMTLLGGGRSAGNDLEGTFYHLMRDRSGNQIPEMKVGFDVIPARYREAVDGFLSSGWSPKAFAPYYRSPVKLYATHFMIPPVASALGPSLFGVDENIQASLWLIHYKGKISRKTGGTFRFRGLGDSILFVRMNSTVVLDASLSGLQSTVFPSLNWQSGSDEHKKYRFGHFHSRVGDWFTLEPGVPVDMEVLMGDVAGGRFCAMLTVQEQGMNYPENRDGAPVLPIFKTMEQPEHILAEIKHKLIPGEAALEGGPVFSAY